MVIVVATSLHSFGARRGPCLSPVLTRHVACCLFSAPLFVHMQSRSHRCELLLEARVRSVPLHCVFVMTGRAASVAKKREVENSLEKRHIADFIDTLHRKCV